MSARIELWSWRLVGGDVRLLSPDEVERASRFVFPRDRDRYIAGRSRLREILGRYIDVEPGAVVFRYGPQGRPEVDRLSFNLSHSKDRALLAISRDAPVGVDIEAIRPIELSVAEAHFAPAEFRALAALPVSGRIPAFYRCWTRKEAYLKARGTGLATDLSSFEVTLRPGEPPRLLRCDSGEAGLWRIEDLDVGPGLAGAVAARSEGRPLLLEWRSRG